ncbi:hypothetical protein PR048_015869 [Dryococelus australis]|uniref:Uncharacterized protein n=1 Tax=Dryococelus australis TaxID=614101 RepID=A0ABQ9HI55_9NEOP|nr:hypothetical protein PR048_015869 [Dryococelus australis]
MEWETGLLQNTTETRHRRLSISSYNEKKRGEGWPSVTTTISLSLILHLCHSHTKLYSSRTLLGTKEGDGPKMSQESVEDVWLRLLASLKKSLWRLSQDTRLTKSTYHWVAIKSKLYGYRISIVHTNSGSLTKGSKVRSPYFLPRLSPCCFPQSISHSHCVRPARGDRLLLLCNTYLFGVTSFDSSAENGKSQLSSTTASVVGWFAGVAEAARGGHSKGAAISNRQNRTVCRYSSSATVVLGAVLIAFLSSGARKHAVNIDMDILELYTFPQIEEIKRRNGNCVLYQQDRALPYCSLATRGVLPMRFLNNWIGRTGPIPWPPRSPDLTSQQRPREQTHPSSHLHTCHDDLLCASVAGARSRTNSERSKNIIPTSRLASPLSYRYRVRGEASVLIPPAAHYILSPSHYLLLDHPRGNIPGKFSGYVRYSAVRYDQFPEHKT